MHFAQADQAEIRQIGVSIGIPLSQRFELRPVLAAVERNLHQPFVNHGERRPDALEAEGRFGENGLARQQGRRYLLGESDGPLMVAVVSIRECDQEACVGNPCHDFEKPVRDERSWGPLTEPASRMNPLELPVFARSSC
jgi:hypothetical protein